MLEDVSELIGSNYYSPLLLLHPPTVPPSDIEECRRRMARLKADRIKLVRVCYNWDIYLHHPKQFMDELTNISTAAVENGRLCEFTFFQFNTSSYFWPNGVGFPAKIMGNFPVTTDPDHGSAKFWEAIVENVDMGCGRIWEQMANIQVMIVDHVDNYSSTWGYEILNEPRFSLRSTDYHRKWGDMNTYIAQRLRNRTSKYIVQGEGIGMAGGAQTIVDEHLIVPRVPKFIYAPHVYSSNVLPADVKRAKDLQLLVLNEGLDIRGIIFGEWGIGPRPWGGAPLDLATMKLFMSTFKNAGLGWTFWTAFHYGALAGSRLYGAPDASGNWPLTDVGQWFMDTKRLLYGI